MRLTPATGGKQKKKNKKSKHKHIYTHIIYIQRHCYRRETEENDEYTGHVCNDNNSVVVVVDK